MKSFALSQTNRFKIFTLCCGFSVFAACNTQKQAKVDKEPMVLSTEELYQNACSRCHDLPEKTKYEGEAWMPVLKSMQKRAHLTDKNIQDIYEWLTKE